MFLFSYHTWGMIGIVLVTLFTWWMYIRSREPQFAAAAALVQIAGVFTFASSMHERYLFPAAALAVWRTWICGTGGFCGLRVDSVLRFS